MSEEDDSSYPQENMTSSQELHEMLEKQYDLWWHLEEPLIRNHFASSSSQSPLSIIDVGCGTGGAIYRLSNLFPNAQLTGVDVVESNVVFANNFVVTHGLDSERIKFQQGSGYDLEDFEDNSFDFVSCRSVLQAVKNPELIVKQLVRILKPNGILHLIGEDYGMFHSSNVISCDKLFNSVIQWFAKTGCDGQIGRKLYSELSREYSTVLHNVNVQYITIDNIKCNKVHFSGMLHYWKDQYSSAIAEYNQDWTSLEQIQQWWDELIQTVESESGYSVWHLPVISAQKK
jgi:ubiquinone/menaquinone biosynthesis C-methylase UbiE